MNKNKLTTIIGGIGLVAIFAVYMCSYQVRFTEVAVLKTFGEFTDKDIKTEPGLYFKWFWPIQSKVITDKRVRVLEDTYEETQTRDSKNILLTTYVCWKVDEQNPYEYHVAARNDEDRLENLRTLVRDQKKLVVAQHDLADFVNTDPQRFKFDAIEQEMLERISAVASAQYGIQVTDLGIRLLSFPKNVTEKVFESMKKNEEKKAARARTEGEAEAQDIRARASAISENILAVAERLAEGIEAEANREVGEYYKEFASNVELRLFLDQLEATREALRERTTLVLDSAIAPFGLIDLERFFRWGPPAAGGARTPTQPEAAEAAAAAEPAAPSSGH